MSITKQQQQPFTPETNIPLWYVLPRCYYLLLHTDLKDTLFQQKKRNDAKSADWLEWRKMARVKKHLSRHPSMCCHSLPQLPSLPTPIPSPELDIWTLSNHPLGPTHWHKVEAPRTIRISIVSKSDFNLPLQTHFGFLHFWPQLGSCLFVLHFPLCSVICLITLARVSSSFQFIF
jgi:hypothetical protein